MTSKFNKEMYRKIKEKKNEPLSSIGQKKLRFTDRKKEKEKEKELVERGSSTLILELDGQEASPGVSIKEVARPLKRLKVGGKGKEKVGSSIWSDAETAVDRVNEFFTLGEMKEISSTPSHEMASRHVHKLVQVTFPALVSHLFCFFFFFPDSRGGFLLVRCWARRCILRPSTWQTKRRPLWPTPKLR